MNLKRTLVLFNEQFKIIVCATLVFIDASDRQTTILIRKFVNRGGVDFRDLANLCFGLPNLDVLSFSGSREFAPYACSNGIYS